MSTLSGCVYVHPRNARAHVTQENARSHRPGVRDEPLHDFWALNTGPKWKQPVILKTDHLSSPKVIISTGEVQQDHEDSAYKVTGFWVVFFFFFLET